ncbi:MAG: bifunctional serine/threonine-protein kinase/formylglycine-generating enzyme family protein [Fuerstiella sp.]
MDGLPQVAHYQCLERLGAGSTADVYRARDHRLSRDVALKVLRRESVSDGLRERFLSEANIAAQVTHQSVVRIYESGVADGRHFIAYELITGVSAREWALCTEPNPLQLAQLFFDISDGAAAAHQQGIVHRDLKPENIIVDLAGLPHITDFGLASLPDRRLTSINVALGTVAYMSPEQARGESHLAEPSSDIYAIGAMMFEMLTGELPSRGQTHAEYLAAVARRSPPKIGDISLRIPKDLGFIVDRCLFLEPRLRYRNCRELADDLEQFLNGRPTKARPLAAGERIVRKAIHHQKMLIAVFVAVCLLTFSALSISYFAINEKGARDLSDQSTIKQLINSRSESLLSNIEEVRPIKEIARDDLERCAVNINQPASNRVNAQIALIAYFADQHGSVTDLLDRADELSAAEIDSFATVASRRFSKQEFEELLASSILEHNERDHGRFAFLSLVAGTKATAREYVSNTEFCEYREAFIDAAAGSKLFQKMATESRYDGELLVAIQTAALIWPETASGQIKDLCTGCRDNGDRPCDALARAMPSRQERGVDIDFIQFKIDNSTYEVSQFEVTVGNLRYFLENHPHATGLGQLYARNREKDDPIPLSQTKLDWVKTFCDEYSKSHGLGAYYGKEDASFTGYRIPTFEEWKSLAHAGGNNAFYWGDSRSVMPRHAWIRSEFPGEEERLMAVGQKRPNRIGLFDLYGNAAEIVNAGGVYKAVGGSSWSSVGYCDPAKAYPLADGSMTIGFRLVREIGSTSTQTHPESSK